MADANVQAILGNTAQPPSNPLQIMSGWQDYANKVAQQRAINAAADLTQQQTQNAALANQNNTALMNQQQRNYIGTQMASLLASKQPITQGVVSTLLDHAQAVGAINDAQYADAQSEIPQGAPDSVYRDYLQGKVIAAQTAANAAERVLPGQRFQDTGNGVQAYSVGGPNAGVGANIPTPAGAPMPSGQMGQGQLNDVITITDAQGNSHTAPRWQILGLPNPNVARGVATTGPATPIASIPATYPSASGSTPSSGTATPSSGTATPSGGSTGSSGGMFSGGPITTPAGQPGMQAADQTAYIQDLRAVPERQQNVQNLTKALGALQEVQTGSGSEWVAGNRAKIVTLLGQLGIQSPLMQNQDFSQAEAEKLLTDYARKSGSAPSSVAQLEASQKSNPSTVVNNQAAQDFIRSFVGQERMKIAAAMQQDGIDKNGIGYQANSAKFANQYDRRGLAFDTYTPDQLKQLVASMPSQADRDKFAASMALAQRMKLATAPDQPVPQPTAPQPSTEAATPMTAGGPN